LTVRRGLAALILLALGGLPAPAAAQPAVVSPAPEAVSVSVYRNPQRGAGEEWNSEWLEGFALISETRTIRLPAGESVIRFEGVAGGIIPASAIVKGLPSGVDEKNRDARLLSPGTLVDAALGRRVHLRRTNRATGKVTETEAVIRSGPDGVVLQTPEGVEALRCTGLPETLTYDRVPDGLTDKPTLAVATHSDRAVTATVRLTYLATGFDWQASYVAQLAPDGKTLDLFSWLTLANSNDESFLDARANAIAGELNKNDDEGGNGEPRPVSSEISLQCWPQGRTSDVAPVSVPGEEFFQTQSDGSDIVVTGSRMLRPNLVSSSPVTVVTAEQEELGDLKLYRIPIPVTVAAHSQKQVALLNRSAIPVERLYGSTFEAGDEWESPKPARILLRMANRKEKGLGLPLPQGQVSVFEPVDGVPMLAGETRVRDYAVGEEVEFEVGESPDVQVMLRRDLARGAKPDDDDDDNRKKHKPRRYGLEITNARAVPVKVEIVLWVEEDQELKKPSRKLGRKNGGYLWSALVPANGTATLRYRVKTNPPPPDPEEE
jgi:hypothetical protein